MCNHLGIDINPFILRNKLHQVKFNLDGVFVFCQPKQVGNALNMCIHHHTGDMIPVSAHNICRFSADTRKGSQLLDIRRNLSVIVLQKLLTAGNDILRLIMIKACRVNILLQLCKVCLCKVLDRGVFLE